MFPLNTFEERLHALLDELDAMAEASGAEALEELNAEFEDALFMLSQIDLKADNWREELLDALEELDALRADYARQPEAGDIAVRMGMLISMLRDNAGARE